MKQIFTILFCLLASGVFAQFTVTEVNESMSQGNQSGLSIEVPEVTNDFILDEWKDYVGKLKGKTKHDKKAGEIFSDDCSIKEISTNTIDIYAKAIAKDKGQKVTIFFNLGGAYLNSKMHQAQYVVAEKMVKEFAVQAVRNSLKAKFDKEKGILKDFEKDKKDLEQAQSKSLGNIEEAKQKIKTEETNIEENKKKQVEKADQILKQNKIVEDLKMLIDKMK